MIHSPTRLAYLLIVLSSMAIKLFEAKPGGSNYVKFYKDPYCDHGKCSPRQIEDFNYYPNICYNVPKNLEKSISSIVMHSPDKDYLTLYTEKNCNGAYGKWLKISHEYIDDLHTTEGFNDVIASFSFSPKVKESKPSWFSKVWNWLG